jgi:hypothetical protein
MQSAKDVKKVTDAPVVIENTQLVDVDGALKEWENYQELTEKLLVPEDYQKFKDGKKFKKKSAWRKYSKAFRLSDEILEKEIIKDDKGRVKEASFVVRVWGKDGRETIGFGNASKFEHPFTKPNHDIPSTAHTRAKNRAISDYIGAGEVSAEEMQDETGNFGEKKKPKSATPKEIDPETVQETETNKNNNYDEVITVKDWKAKSKKCKALKKVCDAVDKAGLEICEINIMEQIKDMVEDKSLNNKEYDEVMLAMGKIPA